MPRAIAIASAASVAAAPRRRPMPIRRPVRFGSSVARTGFVCGSRTAVGRNGSAATAVRRSLAATPATPIRSVFAWAHSTRILGSGQASASSWRTPCRGKRFPMMDYPAFAKVATRRVEFGLDLARGGADAALLLTELARGPGTVRRSPFSARSPSSPARSSQSSARDTRVPGGEAGGRDISSHGGPLSTSASRRACGAGSHEAWRLSSLDKRASIPWRNGEVHAPANQ